MRDKPYSAACRLAFHFATNGSVRGGHVYSPDTKVRVLLVERDTAMVRVLERGLRGHGFEIASTDTASEALTHIEDESIGVVVVDVSSSTGEEWGLLQQIRTLRPSLPLLLLVGGEDCLPKPFALEELISRIRARMRGTDEPRPTTLVAGELRLDLLARCGWRGEQLIDLSSREFALLEYFMRHPGRVLSRQVILADVWGYDEDPASNVVDVYVRYLRNRLGKTVDGQPFIATVRGEGYRFNAPEGPNDPRDTHPSHSHSPHDQAI
jgi:DNA-binding response OmpR family regulator